MNARRPDLPLPASGVHWVGYTTRYREGGPQLAQAARTMARELAARVGAGEVVCEAVESKRDLVVAMDRLRDSGRRLAALHFLGHSGMYGPMFRTTAMPEQFSPHEWKTLAAEGRLPFAPGAEAYFHACRTARWFAPFFARTFGVPASGYHWYTTFSARREHFVWAGPRPAGDRPLYLIGCRGKKSDGLAGSLLKYGGLMRVEPMKRFEPSPPSGDTSYDGVAELYDAVFPDIRVRRDEWRWLSSHLDAVARTRPGGLRVLDIGCGNGALLSALLPRLASGVGVDASRAMIGVAARKNPDPLKLSFAHVDGPSLPLPDRSCDVVISLLSFRYLDWDPLMNEIRRVLAPGGHLLVVDMVTAPVTGSELPRFVADSARAFAGRAANAPYREALGRLVKDPRWATMLAYNPIRAQHEYVWYLESRFPGRRVELLNIGWHNRVLAFDSGPLAAGAVAPQTYP